VQLIAPTREGTDVALKISGNNEKGASPQVPAEQKKVVKPSGGNLQEILAAVRKEKGDRVVVPANAIPKVERLPTGIFDLDFYLGGGFPCGRYSIIYGPESSCKTNIAMKAVSQAQRRTNGIKKAIWMNIEQTFDPPWAQKMGVDTNELLVVNPSYGEEAVDIFDAVVRAEDVGIIVVDSLAALIANKEVEQSMENYDIGTSALLIKRMVNKLMIAFGDCAKRGHYPCVLFINQTRFKPGVLFGDPETMPGGEAQKFLSSLRIRTSAKNVIDKATSQVMFKEVSVTVKKSKVPVRAVSFSFNLCMTPTNGLEIGDTNSFNMVKDYLHSLGLLTKHPKGYLIEGQPDIWPTISKIQEVYRSDSAFALKLQTMVNDAVQEEVLVDEPVKDVEVQPGIAKPAKAG
jgi:recombination protein RecA